LIMIDDLQAEQGGIDSTFPALSCLHPEGMDTGWFKMADSQ